MSATGRPRRSTRAALLLATAVLVGAALATPPAVADEYPPGTTPPTSTGAAQRGTATPSSSPTSTCRMYGSSSGFGVLCSDSRPGQTLAQRLKVLGFTGRFCWDDPDLPDGFVPDRVETGPGRWWLHTCLTFEGAVVRSNARLSYEYHWHVPGSERVLTDREADVISTVTGRGQIPFLQAQASPLSSPRVDQDVAFSLLCDNKVSCTDTAAGRQIRTPALSVGGVTMFAEIVHLRVLPEGALPRQTNCTGAGLAQTAEQLDRGSPGDPRVCRYRYLRSSDEAGGGSSGDRYPARVTAYWQIYYDEGGGPQPLGLPYEKTTVNQIRVTEVQTLVVS